MSDEYADFKRDEIQRLTREPDEARQECTCQWVDPKYWTTHYGAIEPGSTQEYDPTCPKHGALVDKVERLTRERDEMRQALIRANDELDEALDENVELRAMNKETSNE